MKVTYNSLLKDATESLQNANIKEAKLDASLLLEEIFGVNRAFLLGHANDDISEADTDKIERFLDCIEKRSHRIPLQHIVGHQNFMGLEFEVNEHVLIPRQDTEILVEEALKELHDGMSILDMCTGSGCILTSLLYYSNDCDGVGVDISKDALLVATKNSERILQGKSNSKFCYVNSNLFDNLDNTIKYDMIVSNPPYIRSSVIDELEVEVKEHDPRIALDGGEDGLVFYRSIIEKGTDYLKKGGCLFFEIGFDQSNEVEKLLLDCGYKDVKTFKDYAGLDRVVYGRVGF